MPADRQVGQATGNGTGGIEQAGGAQACPLGGTGAARGERHLGSGRGQRHAHGRALHPDKAMPLAADREPQIQLGYACRLVGEERVGAALLERVRKLRLAEEIG